MSKPRLNRKLFPYPDPRHPESYDQRWLARVLASGTRNGAGCLIWQGFVAFNGYGLHSYGRHGRRTGHIHRLLFEVYHQVKLDRWEYVCHSCDTRLCIEIGHLFKGTPQLNMDDMAAKGRASNQQKTHCPRGHAYDEKNTYYTPREGYRACLACSRARMRIRNGWPADLAFSIPVDSDDRRPWRSRISKVGEP